MPPRKKKCTCGAEDQPSKKRKRTKSQKNELCNKAILVCAVLYALGGIAFLIWR